ncbi:MAG: hypothetical protein KBA40_01975 [Candidatus Peribacteraceae bacterium]|nr:hypothetical protein [Candidatus Peribacteraceae bacterium]MBP9850192.1 hypothetical protein [Candidatus Peribacteraceae bacterium]
MSKKHWIIVGVVVLVLVIVSALQAMSGMVGRKVVENAMERASNGTADVDMNADGTMKITTKDGEFQTGNSIPEEWPKDIAVYAGASITYSAMTNPLDNKAGMALVLLTDDTAAEVKTFYETTLKANGWTITNTMQGGGTVIMTAEKDDRKLSLAIAESQDHTGITIGVEMGS